MSWGEDGQSIFGALRAAYDFVRPSRFLRRRSDLPAYGAPADYHFGSQEDYLRGIELARHAYRNDAIVRPMVNMAVMNIVSNGFVPDPDTGDDALNAELYERFEQWANDPRAYDVAGQLTWLDVQNVALRSMFVDGDVFVLPLDGGRLQIIEAHRCRTPGPLGKAPQAVLGVVLDEVRRRVGYWLTNDDVDLSLTWLPPAKFTLRSALKPDGTPNILHVYEVDRATQTRGMTRLHAVFRYLSIFEDINFAKLVQQQMASCFAIIKERVGTPPPLGGTAQLGPRTSETRLDGSVRVIEGISPGMFIEGAAGETLKGFSPQVPNPEYFEHARLTLQIIGLSMGLPIVMTLMDASETNFSGWRGAVDQARRGFAAVQQTLRTRLHDPVWAWKLGEWVAEDAALARVAARLGDRFRRVRWNTPRWPYIQPLQDAQADTLRMEKRLTSPRRLHAERGQDVDEIVDETIADNARALRRAIAESRSIADETGIAVDAMRLLDLNTTLSVGTAVASAGAAPQALNGAQITAAIDVMTKLRDATLEPLVAVELLVGIGIERARPGRLGGRRVVQARRGESVAPGRHDERRDLQPDRRARPATAGQHAAPARVRRTVAAGCGGTGRPGHRRRGARR